ncbi:MAG: asparaginase [Planctomycetota bacterium]
MFDVSFSSFPANPVVVRLWRGGAVESVHRGAWCLADPAGNVLGGAGDLGAPHYARSSIKAIQALPLLETGAAARFGLDDGELAVTLASHNGEPAHVAVVEGLLARIGARAGELACGAQEPLDGGARDLLRDARIAPGPLHNNCSGKHAGFLALARHLGVPAARYLDPASEGQRLVRAALAALTDLDAERLVPGIDGCSAPNWRVPLARLATAFARLANPAGLPAERAAAARRLQGAAARRPDLVAGRGRLDTDLLRASGGRLFAKGGAEGMYAVGVVGEERGLALKIDDGGGRAAHALLLALLETLRLATAAELAPLAAWRDGTLRNRAGIAIGRIEAVVE